MSKLFLKIFSIVGILFATNVIYAQETIKIGAPLALTGGLADEGKKQQIAYDMWLKKVNAAGGIQVGNKKMKVELITYDYQTDEKRAQTLAERLITQDKVAFLTSPFGTSRVHQALNNNARSTNIPPVKTRKLGSSLANNQTNNVPKTTSNRASNEISAAGNTRAHRTTKVQGIAS